MSHISLQVAGKCILQSSGFQLGYELLRHGGTAQGYTPRSLYPKRSCALNCAKPFLILGPSSRKCYLPLMFSMFLQHLIWWYDILIDKTVCAKACESCQNQAQHKIVKENPMPSNTATLFKTQILTQLHLKSKRDKFTVLYSMSMFPKRSLTTPFLKPILCQLTKRSSGWFSLAFEHTWKTSFGSSEKIHVMFFQGGI